MTYRIVEEQGVFYVQKRSFFFWTICYIYSSDYSRRPAIYYSYEDAMTYFNLKGFLED